MNITEVSKVIIYGGREEVTVRSIQGAFVCRRSSVSCPGWLQRYWLFNFLLNYVIAVVTLGAVINRHTKMYATAPTKLRFR